MAKLDENTLLVISELESGGMQNRLDTCVRTSIDRYRDREKALKKIKELSRRDAWGMAMEIKLMASREVKLWRRLCQEHYGFDVERWLAEGSTDFSPLTHSLSSKEATAIVTHVLSYAHWKCIRILVSAAEEAAIELS